MEALFFYSFMYFFFILKESNDDSLFESNPVAYFDDTEGRVRGSKPENRLFGTVNLLAALINRLNNNTNTLINLPNPFSTTFTSTILKTTILSKTVASIQSCIGVAQFVVNGAVTSTAVCSRKRRGINVDEETEDLIEVIAPSQVEPYAF